MFLLLSSLVLGACSSDDDELAPQQPQSYPLTIEVTENPMVQDGDEGRGNRAAITTTTSASFNAFKIDYTYGSGYSTGSVDVTNDNGTWTGGSWPFTSEEVTWYAYTGGTFNVNSGNPYINFTVDENAADQHDLLVATTSGTWSGTSGILSFNFDHACAALRFKIKKAKALTVPLYISSVKLYHVSSQENYYYKTKTWSELGSNYSNYTLFTASPAVELTSTTEYVTLNGTSEENAYLFLIPQTLIGDVSTGTYIEIAWECSAVSPGSGTAKIPFSYTLEKGKKHDVKINLGTTTLTLY